MSKTNPTLSNRRDFLKTTSTLGAVAAVTGVGVPAAHAAGSDLIQIALVGCGGRGTGAAKDALGTKSGPIKIIAMADVFEARMARSVKSLADQGEKFAVTKETQFLGFDAYKKAMDMLKKGDVVLLTTPPAFRWPMFAYAISKGLNVFMEKPVSVDGPTTKKMFALADEATKKNLKVGVGLMIRHCKARQELRERIRNGEIGDISYMRAYRMGAMGDYCGPKPEADTEVGYQLKNFHSFLWASGGVFSDYNIHQIDETSWMKSAWPVKAIGFGGRHYRAGMVDQNFDTYQIEYTYADGTKLFFGHRQMPGCHTEFASYVHGTKGSAIVTTNSHHPGRVRMFGDQTLNKESLIWAYPQPELNPYQLEWDNLIQAIRNDKPHNEVRRGAEASLVTAMGRAAAHTGQLITFDQMLESEHEFAPGVDKLTMEGPAPIVADKEGKYAVPQPGSPLRREY